MRREVMARSASLSPFERHLRDLLASARFDLDVFPGCHVLESPSALAVVETRRGKWSTATNLEVLMAISVTSRVLADTFGQPVAPGPPTLDAHWYRDPVQFEGEPWVELWGSVPRNDPGSWHQRDADLSQRIMPMLLDHASDEGLVRCWREHPRHWHVPRARRLVYRALLEQAIGADPTTTIGLLWRFLKRCPSAPGLVGMEPGLAELERIGVRGGL